MPEYVLQHVRSASWLILTHVNGSIFLTAVYGTMYLTKYEVYYRLYQARVNLMILSTCPIRAVTSKSDLSELPHFYYKSISLTIYPASALGAVGTITGNQDISCNRDELPQYVFSYSNTASLRKRSSCGFTVIKHLRGHSLPPIFHM